MKHLVVDMLIFGSLPSGAGKVPDNEVGGQTNVLPSRLKLPILISNYPSSTFGTHWFFIMNLAKTLTLTG